MEDIIDSGHLRFVKAKTTARHKTYKYMVLNKKQDILLAYIKWYAPWRCYALFVQEGVIFDKQCMDIISDFMQSLKLNRLLVMREIKHKKDGRKQCSFDSVDS